MTKPTNHALPQSSEFVILHCSSGGGGAGGCWGCLGFLAFFVLALVLIRFMVHLAVFIILGLMVVFTGAVVLRWLWRQF